MRTQNLQKRVEVLEASQAHIGVPGCDPNRRLARYASYFNGRPWTCQNPEKCAMREEAHQADLARYREYFEEEASDEEQH